MQPSPFALALFDFILKLCYVDCIVMNAVTLLRKIGIQYFCDRT